MRLINSELQDLARLNLPELRQSWTHHYDAEVPATMSQELLRLSVGYKLQEAKFGGLDRKTLLRLSAMKFGSETTDKLKSAVSRPAPKSGTKFIREWRGKVHEVSVLDDGQFAYSDRRYKSLTVIAREITGTHQSGPKFFGIKAPGETKAVGSNALG